MCFIKDTSWIPNIDVFNIDNISWESDYPHSDGTWPWAPEELIKAIGHLPDDVIEKISYKNAMEHYSFDPFTHIPKAEATAGALRAKSPDVDVVTRVGREADERDLAAWSTIVNAGLQAQSKS